MTAFYTQHMYKKLKVSIVLHIDDVHTHFKVWYKWGSFWSMANVVKFKEALFTSFSKAKLDSTDWDWDVRYAASWTDV